MFQRIAEEYEFRADTIEVVEGHVHAFIEVSLKCCPAQVVQILRDVSAREVSKKPPKLRRKLWGKGFGVVGIFVRSVGGKVTADIARNYIA